MPKAVDIYVLQKKIGSGQFGDVFKGYSKVDGVDVAIKTIRRDKIKGKFTQLLENQIQVLKSCKNNNIVQLIDIKKTVNNIYLILQYCNEGDLNGYLKDKKKIPEDQAIQYLVQILHGFHTLVKNKIMHRDFKLANVLKCDGVIKIADFGFAKLLGSQDQQVETILGSPLNMAPQVLNHQVYNSKADIWSIGVSFYQLLFGKVPYTASNIVDLLKKINKEPLIIPHKVSKVCEDILRRMLVVDANKRIQWDQLFNHPIIRYRQEKLQDGLKKSMLCENNELSFNLSKFYIKANMVVENIHQIHEKSQFNNYLKQAMKNEKCQEYNGKTIRRQTERTKKFNPSSKENFTQEDKLKSAREIQSRKQIEEDDFTQAELNTKQFKNNLMKYNSQKIFHQRNIYAFLGHLAEELLQINKNAYAQCLGFLLVKRVMELITKLKRQLEQCKHPRVTNWNEYQMTSQYNDIKIFISSEYEIFSRFYEKLSIKVLSKGTLQQFQDDLMISGKFTLQETNRIIYERVLRQYFKRLLQKTKKLSIEDWKHVGKLIDSTNVEFMFNQNFNFQKYYGKWIQDSDKNIEEDCKKRYQIFIKKK